jgi:hypothetical protein
VTRLTRSCASSQHAHGKGIHCDLEPSNILLARTTEACGVSLSGTQRNLGVTLEVFDGLPDGKRKPDAT